MRRRELACALLGGALGGSVRATTVVEGASFEDAVTIGGQRLILNGVGVAMQLIEKVHVSALYLQAPQTDPVQLLGMVGPKRIETVFLRKVSSRALTRFFVNGMRSSAEARSLMQHISDVARFGELFSKGGDRNAGDRIAMDWVPGRGLEARVSGQLVEPVVNNEVVFRLLLDLYTGASANKRLREGLLAGGPAKVVK
jgi:hypothetical protein